MATERNDTNGATPHLAGLRPGLAITLKEASDIAAEVRRLISLGQEERALQLVHSLHPADMGLIIAGLPRTSRDIILGIMSPDTVTWMLRQMNPVEAGSRRAESLPVWECRRSVSCSGRSIHSRRWQRSADCR